VSPRAIAAQKGRRAASDSTGGRPGDHSLLRMQRADLRRPVFVIVHLHYEVLRRPIESTSTGVPNALLTPPIPSRVIHRATSA
jgi:hypothetical protein